MVPTARVAVIPPAAVNEALVRIVVRIVVADVSRPVRKPRVRPAPSPLRIFPVSRTIQGIWARKGPSRRYSPRFREQIQGVPYKFPRYRNREFRWLNRPIALSLIENAITYTTKGPTLKGTDCKSVGSAYAASNPAPPPARSPVRRGQFTSCRKWISFRLVRSNRDREARVLPLPSAKR